MKSKILVLVVILSLFIGSGSLTAKERRGAELVVQKKDGQQVRGELIAVKQASLLLLESLSGADVSIKIGDIKLIKIIRKSKALIGAGIGALALAGLGALEPYSEFKVLGMVIVGIMGLIVGATIGALAGIDYTIKIEGKTDVEIKGILEKLHHQAQIINAQ
jgi:hypothetical protein